MSKCRNVRPDPIAPCRMSLNAKLIELRRALRSYHSRHGNFPQDLNGSKHDLNLGDVFNWEIADGEYAYVASNDLQSFTLAGRTFGPKLKDQEKYNRITALYDGLLAYEDRCGGKLPQDLQELIDNACIYDASIPNDPMKLYEPEIRAAIQYLQEEKLEYSVSEGGTIAYINGEGHPMHRS